MAYAPDELEEERERLLAEIHEAFAGVSREGGVSWNEAVVRDNYGSQEECEQARKTDKDRSWQDLLDDDKWQPSPGIGGWSFLDAVGFRYYIPAGMVRCIRLGDDDGIEFHLTLKRDDFDDWHLEKWSVLDIRQRSCIARFLRYMTAVTRADDPEAWYIGWEHALENYWSQYAE